MYRLDRPRRGKNKKPVQPPSGLTAFRLSRWNAGHIERENGRGGGMENPEDAERTWDEAGEEAQEAEAAAAAAAGAAANDGGGDDGGGGGGDGNGGGAGGGGRPSPPRSVALLVRHSRFLRRKRAAEKPHALLTSATHASRASRSRLLGKFLKLAEGLGALSD